MFLRSSCIFGAYCPAGAKNTMQKIANSTVWTIFGTSISRHTCGAFAMFLRHFSPPHPHFHLEQNARTCKRALDDVNEVHIQNVPRDQRAFNATLLVPLYLRFQCTLTCSLVASTVRTPSGAGVVLNWTLGPAVPRPRQFTSDQLALTALGSSEPKLFLNLV